VAWYRREKSSSRPSKSIRSSQRSRAEPLAAFSPPARAWSLRVALLPFLSLSSLRAAAASLSLERETAWVNCQAQLRDSSVSAPLVSFLLSCQWSSISQAPLGYRKPKKALLCRDRPDAGRTEEVLSRRRNQPLPSSAPSRLVLFRASSASSFFTVPPSLLRTSTLCRASSPSCVGSSTPFGTRRRHRANSKRPHGVGALHQSLLRQCLREGGEKEAIDVIEGGRGRLSVSLEVRFDRRRGEV
jgi:hypothetical protein